MITLDLAITPGPLVLAQWWVITRSAGVITGAGVITRTPGDNTSPGDNTGSAGVITRSGDNARGGDIAEYLEVLKPKFCRNPDF